MRPIPIIAAAIPLLALAACHDGASLSSNDDTDGNVHVAMNNVDGRNQLSVNVPGVDAKLTLPAFDLGKHVDLDGIRLAPQTIVKTIDVAGEGKDGHVRIAFTSPYQPTRLIGYYRDTATHAGYSATVNGTSGLDATKGDNRFALSVAPAGDGSSGAITISGDD